MVTDSCPEISGLMVAVPTTVGLATFFFFFFKDGSQKAVVKT